MVAEVMEEKRLIMYWRDKVIVNISRAFLDTNGAHQEAKVEVNVPKREGNPFDGCAAAGQPVKEAWLNTLKDLNVCSQKGLVEMFDSTIGAGSVLMPFGGTYQLTETQAMVAKLPVLSGETDAVTMMSYGFDPYLSSWSPYHGAIYAVISSVAKIVAAGGDYRKIRFTFQEYFRKLGQDPKRWGDPFAALLGAYNAQMGFGLPSIGGKDSMSGSFNEIDVPPTLVSFAVDTGSYRHVISPELKQAGNKLVLFRIRKDEKALPDYAQIMDLYGKIHEDIAEGNILSAYEIERHGLAEALAKMAFGNKLGISVSHTVDSEEFFGAGWGNLVAEVPANRVAALHAEGEVIGEVTDEGKFIYGGAELSMEEALAAWTGTLDSVFPAKAASQAESAERPLYEKGSVAVCTHKLARPTVFIPAFPGTNCEIDSKKAMEAAGANVIVQVMRNLTAEDIRNSVEDFAKGIRQAQIIMFPGGFSAGDEPDGSAKFFATAFRNAKIKAVSYTHLRKKSRLSAPPPPM